MDQDIRAEARHIPISAQKARLVIDLVRGKDVVEALEPLGCCQRGEQFWDEPLRPVHP